MRRKISAVGVPEGFHYVHDYYTYPENEDIIRDLVNEKLNISFEGNVHGFIEKKTLDEYIVIRGVIREKDLEQFDNILIGAGCTLIDSDSKLASRGAEFIIVGLTKNAATDVITEEEAKNVDLSDFEIESDLPPMTEEIQYALGVCNGVLSCAKYSTDENITGFLGVLLFRLNGSQAKKIHELFTSEYGFGIPYNSETIDIARDEMKLELRRMYVNVLQTSSATDLSEYKPPEACYPKEIQSDKSYIYSIGFKIVRGKISEHDDTIIYRGLYLEDDDSVELTPYYMVGGISGLTTTEIKLINHHGIMGAKVIKL